MPNAPFSDTLSLYAPPAAQASGNLAGEAAKQNLSAAGDIGSLSTLLQNINNLNNTNRVYGGAGLERQSSQNIQNELAGILPQSYLENLQSGMAQRGAAGGFGVDSANTNAAALRAMGLETMDLQRQGQQDLTGAYNRAAPLVDASQFAVTPGLVAQQQDAAAQRALQAQAQANAMQEWQAQLAAQQSQYGQSLAQRQLEYQGTLGQQQAEFAQTLQQKKDELAQQMGLSYSQLNQSQRQFVDSQAQQMTQWAGTLQAQVAQQQQQNALEQERLAAQEQQFAQSQAQRAREFGTTSGLNAAQLYAQMYGTLPGYNQTGQYTGQVGTYPGYTPAGGAAGPTVPMPTPGQGYAALAAFDAQFPGSANPYATRWGLGSSGVPH